MTRRTVLVRDRGAARRKRAHRFHRARRRAYRHLLGVNRSSVSRSLVNCVLVSSITLGNALCGLLGCVALMRLDASFTHAIGMAAACVFIGFVLDRLDGTLARRLGVDSPFGAQLDSLCDVLSFGLLPALLIAAPAVHAGSAFVIAARIAVALIYLIAAIVRLARFTLAATGVPNAEPMLPIMLAGDRHYRGLPSPAAAMAVASIVLFEIFGSYGALFPIQLARHDLLASVLPMLIGAAAALAMVMPWPYADPPRAFASGRWPWPLLVLLLAIGIISGPFVAMSVFAIGYLPTGLLLARRLEPAAAPVQAKAS